MSDFADHYPIQLICELLGVPREDHGKFGKWSNDITWVLSLELSSHMDLRPAFTAAGGDLFQDTQHPNGRGLAVAADAVAATL